MRVYTKEFKELLQQKALLGLSIKELTEEMNNAFTEYHLTEEKIRKLISRENIIRKRPEKEKKVLTPEEQVFAGENHNLIYSFLNKYDLNESDWYDLIAIGYLNAVMDWYRVEKIKNKYTFSTVAYTSMKEAYIQHLRYLRAKKRPQNVLSIDREILKTETEFIDMIEDASCEKSFQDIIFFNDFNILMENLTDSQKKILLLLLMGYKHKEITMIDKNLNWHKQWRSIKKIRQQIMESCFF